MQSARGPTSGVWSPDLAPVEAAFGVKFGPACGGASPMVVGPACLHEFWPHRGCDLLVMSGGREGSARGCDLSERALEGRVSRDCFRMNAEPVAKQQGQPFVRIAGTSHVKVHRRDAPGATQGASPTAWDRRPGRPGRDLARTRFAGSPARPGLSEG